MPHEGQRIRYCPACGGLLTKTHNSRFLTCLQHGKLDVTMRQVKDGKRSESEGGGS